MEQLQGLPFEFRYLKMFGEYCVYANEKPIFLVCDNMVYIKMLPCLEALMNQAEQGKPYEGAKLHYILDIDHSELVRKVVPLLEQNIPLPKPKKRKEKKK